MVEKKQWNGGRFTPRGRAKWVVLLVFVIGGLVTLGIATSGSGRGTLTSPATGLCNDKLTQMEQSGAVAAMLKQHQQMMEQMRVGLSPQMQQLMDADPMWESMRTGDFTEMMQDQQQQIDRMLGSASTCGAP